MEKGVNEDIYGGRKEGEDSGDKAEKSEIWKTPIAAMKERKRPGKPTKAEAFARERANSEGSNLWTWKKRAMERDSPWDETEQPFKKSTKIGRLPTKDMGREEEEETRKEEGRREEESKEELGMMGMMREVMSELKKIRRDMKEIKEEMERGRVEKEELKCEVKGRFKEQDKRMQSLEGRMEKMEERYKMEEDKWRAREDKEKKLEKEKKNRGKRKGGGGEREEVVREGEKMRKTGEKREKNNILIKGIKTTRTEVKEKGTKFLEEEFGFRGKILGTGFVGGKEEMIWMRLESWEEKEEIMRKKNRLGERKIYIDNDLTRK